jgi:DinB superfamily
MHPRIEELLSYLEVRRASLGEAVDAVPAARRAERPESDRWSVAEVLEHLALVECRFKTVLADKLEEAKARGLAAERDTSSIVGSYDVAPMLDRSSKHEAPEVVRPTGTDWQTAWNRLEDVRRSFLEVFRGGDGLALGDVIHSHPRLGSLNLYQWGVWLGGHEARHTEQVHEIAASLKSQV